MPRGVAKDPSKDKRRKNVGRGKFPQRGLKKKGKLDTFEKMEGDSRTRTPEQKYEAALMYAIHGTFKGAARKCSFDVVDTTISTWSKTEWWHELQVQIADEIEARNRAQFDKIINKAHKETIDRLDKGDVIYDTKRGTQVRVPVKAKDAMTIAAIGYDKRRISHNLPTSITNSGGSKQLENLADQFKQLAQNFTYKKVRDEKSITAEYREESDEDEKKGS